MTQLERYIYLIELWQSKMIEYKSLYEHAEKQLNFYTQKRIDYELNANKVEGI